MQIAWKYYSCVEKDWLNVLTNRGRWISQYVAFLPVYCFILSKTTRWSPVRKKVYIDRTEEIILQRSFRERKSDLCSRFATGVSLEYGQQILLLLKSASSGNNASNHQVYSAWQNTVSIKRKWGWRRLGSLTIGEYMLNRSKVWRGHRACYSVLSTQQTGIFFSFEQHTPNSSSQL